MAVLSGTLAQVSKKPSDYYAMYGQAQVDAFLKANPNDFHRISEALDPVKPASSSTPTSGGSTSGTGGGATGYGAGGGPPGGIGTGQVANVAPNFKQAAAQPGSVEGAVGGLMSAGPGMSQPQPVDVASMLRQGIGSRLYPNENSAIAGLKKVY